MRLKRKLCCLPSLGFHSRPVVLGYAVCLFFTFGGFYLAILQLRDSFLHHVQFVNKPIKGILHFYYSVFDL